MRKALVILVPTWLSAVGCGTRTDPGAWDAADADVVADTGAAASDIGADTSSDEDSMADAGFDSTLPYVLSLDVCPSAEKADKIIFHLAEPLGKLPVPSPVHVAIEGNVCSDAWDARPSYALGTRCGPIDPTKPIVVTVSAPLTAATGTRLPPGKATFRIAGGPGKLCGNSYSR